MGESALVIPDQLGGEPDFESALFHRRIEFQLSPRPFNGFGSGTSDGFKMVTLNPNAETNKGAGAVSVKIWEKMELFEVGFDRDLNFKFTFRGIGAGLLNHGNTCFINSVLQCLTYTEPLVASLRSGKHQNSCREAGFCALCAIQKHVCRALQSTGRILDPKDLVSNLRCISRSFRNARQEDAHEYMVNLLESMHRCCLPSGVPSESPSAYEESLVHRIFGGRLRSQVKCMQCSFCSNKFDPFLDLSLEIVKGDSLIKALAHFTAKEHLDGGAKVYQCDNCKQKVKALKQLSVHKAPHVLAIHLKRFSSHLEGQKIVKKVAFGPKLNMRPFVTGPYDGDLNYKLYGVLVHAGWSTHSGHYYCYVRTSNGMWYSLDDNQVIQVNERTVLEQKAYMLFYVRDRTTFNTKKSVKVVTKESTVLNPFGAAASSKFSVDVAGNFHNVSIEKKPDEAFPASLAHTVPVLSYLPKESPPTKEHSVDSTAPVADCKDPDHGPRTEHSSGALLSENNLKDHFSLPGIGNSQVPPMENNLMDHSSLLNSREKGQVTPVVDNLEDHSSLPNSSGNSEVPPRENNLMDHSSLSNSRENGHVTPVVDNLKDHSSLPNSSGNGEVPPSENNLMDHSSLLKSSGNVQVPPAENNVKDHSALLKSIGNGQVPPTENNVKVHSSLLKSCINVQVEGPSGDTAADSTLLGTHENGMEVSQNVACGVETNKKLNLKVRRKLLKYHIAATSLSSVMMLYAVHRTGKKNPKLRKRHSMKKKGPNRKVLLARSGLRANSQSSVSESPLPTVVECTPQKKNAESCCAGDIQGLSSHAVTADSINRSMNPGFRSRIVPYGPSISAENPTVLLSGARRPSDTTCTAENPTVLLKSRQAESKSMHTRELPEAEVMSMLTRDKTIVAHWDGIDFSPDEQVETSAAGPLQLGYIGDEWDEDYDRGKRKKVREPKPEFDGRNFFQEHSMRTYQLKRAKLNQMRNLGVKQANLNRPSSENYPFRI